MKKMLVIDDEPHIGELMGIYLKTMGYEADIFSSAEEALAEVERGKYKAVFCDYKMPSMKGDAVHSKIKEKDEMLAKNFIMTTGAILDEELELFLKREDISMLVKPFRSSDVKEALERSGAL